MKKIFLLFVFCSLVLAANCRAVDFKADLSIKTGDSSLDLHLRNVNEKASTPAGVIEIKKDLRENLSLTDREIIFLSKKGYTLAEINYLAMLAKQSGKSVNDVAALHSQGAGWGVMAKRLGVRPSDLNKFRVQKKKQEKIQMKMRAPKAPIMKEAPMELKGSRGTMGGGHGMGRGKGK